MSHARLISDRIRSADEYQRTHCHACSPLIDAASRSLRVAAMCFPGQGYTIIAQADLLLGNLRENERQSVPPLVHFVVPWCRTACWKSGGH